MNYSEIVQLWSKSKLLWSDYCEEVGMVGVKIYTYFIKKLDIDPKEAGRIIKLFPPTEEDTEKIWNTWYAPFACVEMKDNGKANIGLILLLENDKNTYPKNQYKFYLDIRYDGNNWHVKIAEDGETYLLSKNPKDEEIEGIWNEFESLIKIQTIESLDRWLGIKK